MPARSGLFADDTALQGSFQTAVEKIISIAQSQVYSVLVALK